MVKAEMPDMEDNQLRPVVWVVLGSVAAVGEAAVVKAAAEEVG